MRLISSTFTSLCALANFDAPPPATEAETADEIEETAGKPEVPEGDAERKKVISIPFRHNVEVHLPATTNIVVYNAIFKSLRDHLLD